ncbi:MAG TPA: ArdC-like ssDNA-binding domain-containing protein [Bryobacteraceae bacterium]|nr:ArdC-like ssDNA-binding domain-containing protein [Bryobacteraceae bacterium]
MQITETKQVVSHETSHAETERGRNSQARQLAEEGLNKLAAALESGKSEALVNYLSVMSRFHRYSWNNCLLIALQRPGASHVAGFHAWRKLGRHVRKGAKGIAIFAPMVFKKKSNDEESEDEHTRAFGFRTAYVFDVADTDGAELPEFATVKGDPKHYTERLAEFVASNGIRLEYSADIAPAKGISRGGCIVLLPEMSSAETLNVLAHETAHELLHRGARRKETTTTIRETEAEAVAFVVCHAIGLETGTAASDYIQLWRGDKATLSESLQFIQTTAVQILAAIAAGQEGPSRSTPTL